MATYTWTNRRRVLTVDATSASHDVILPIGRFVTDTFRVQRSDASGNTVTIKNSDGNTVTTVPASSVVAVQQNWTGQWVVVAQYPATGGGGSGTVTSVSVVTANGVSGSVATATTTPAITLTLGAITPTSVAASGAVSGSNLSGTNTGDQTITLTGDVTGSGTSSFAATIANDAVTYAKLQNVSAASVLIGRGAGGGSGDAQEITLGTNLSMSGTTLNASGGSASATTVEKDLGSTPTWRGKFTITDAAISGTSKVLCWQAPGPYTGKGTRADEAEAQPVKVTAVEPGSGSATVYWETPPMVTQSPVFTDAARLNTVGATFDRLNNQRWPTVYTPTRLGRVRGNVKFSYLVF